MREDYLEALERMFPDGFLVLYSCPDGQLRALVHNPHEDPTIEAFRKHVRANSDEKETRDDAQA